MATLYNPLDRFQTYSIHHIIVACRSTEDAKAFLDDSQNVKTLAAINDVPQLGEPITGVNQNSFLVVDTRKFSQFTVDNLKYETLIGNVDDHTNLPTNMEMVLTDHSGISFVNFIQWLVDEQMGTSFDGIVFVHRIIFIGHTPEGTTETVQSVSLPCLFFSIQLNLELGKGTYTMKMQPTANFNTRAHARWVNIGTASRYFTGKGTNFLGDIINSFETQLNNASAAYYAEVQSTMQSTGKTKNGQPYGRLVTYMITIPKEWERFPFSGAATAAATETIFKREKANADLVKTNGKGTKDAKTGQPLDTNLSVAAGLRITEVLDIIFSQVKDIAELGAGVKNKDSVTFYKHFVGITSNDQYVTVHVDVVPFEVPNIVPVKGKQAADGEAYKKYFTSLDDGALIPKNYAEFDYVFTGNNKDILSFDVKFQELMLLLQSDLNIGPNVFENKNAKDATKGSGVDENGELIKLRAYDPILIPRNTADELSNFKKYTSLTTADSEKRDIAISQKYMRNLSMHYTQQAYEAQLTIRGNPDIMTKFFQTSFQQHVSDVTVSPTAGKTVESRIDTTVKSTYRENFERSILENNKRSAGDGVIVQEIVKEGAKFKVAATLGNNHFSTTPVFVLINVKGPKIDFRTGAQLMGGEFAELLFQNNFFQVMKVVNNIEGHKFTQELSLAGTLNPRNKPQEPKKL
ncbi:hypothetical protein [Acinetobacter sp.]|uniref:hypothetical protein n=1 Tax=Acinetobacter sp. TaxID=472 RepID=UPI003890F88B